MTEFCQSILILTFIAVPVVANVYHDVRRRQLTEVPSDIPDDVTHLILRENNMATFRTDSLNNLRQLAYMDASYNKLTSFPDLTPVAQTLQYLIIQRNLMTSISPDLLDKLTSLFHLDLKSNQLTTIPDVSGPSATLTKLYLSYNKFTEVPDIHLLGNKVTIFDLSGNPISSVSSSKFRNMSMLYQLDMISTSITTFPNLTEIKNTVQVIRLNNCKIVNVTYDSLKDFIKLRHLELQNNLLNDFPNGPFPAQTLTALFLKGNLFKKIVKLDLIGSQLTTFSIGSDINETQPEDFLWMTSVQKLYININKICVFPNLTHIANRLTVIDLSSNCMHYIPEDLLNALTSLQSLNLGKNQLSAFPDVFGPGSSLHTLYLHENQFTTVPKLNVIGSKLQRLNLDNNQLTSFYHANISSLLSLRYLHLFNNKLTVYPDCRFLPKLEYINLHTNAITSIPTEYVQYLNVTKKMTISLYNNKLESLPPFVGQGGFSIDVRVNPMKCDNALLWAVRDSKVTMYLNCASPEKFKGRSYGTLKVEDVAATSVVEGTLVNADLLHDGLEDTCTKIDPVPVKFRTSCSPIPSNLILKLQGEFDLSVTFITRVTVTLTGSGCNSSYISVHASDQEPNSCRSTGTTEWRVKVCDLVGQDENDFGALKCLYECPMAKIMYINFNEYMASNTTVCDIAFQKDTL